MRHDEAWYQKMATAIWLTIQAFFVTRATSVENMYKGLSQDSLKLVNSERQKTRQFDVSANHTYPQLILNFNLCWCFICFYFRNPEHPNQKTSQLQLWEAKNIPESISRRFPTIDFLGIGCRSSLRIALPWEAPEYRQFSRWTRAQMGGWQSSTRCRFILGGFVWKSLLDFCSSV